MKEKKFNEESQLLDIAFFQEIQNKLSDEFGIASIITDTSGTPLTNPSNFSSFCTKYIRNSSEGNKKCQYCDALGGISAKQIMKPVIYSCHAGLTDFASPIIIKDKLVGCFLCGQILTNNLSKDHFKKVAENLNINDSSFYSALEELPIISFEKIKYYANFVFEVSTKISNFSSYQNTGNKATKDFQNTLNLLNSKITTSLKYQSSSLSLKELFNFKSFNEHVSEQKILENIKKLNENTFNLKNNINDFNLKLKNVHFRNKL